MATQAVSNVSVVQESQNFFHDRRTDLKQLGNALASGDLTAAQQAYDTMVALGQSSPFGNSEPFSRADRAQAFDAIGQALQAGDLAGAQAAFANLRQTFGHHHQGDSGERSTAVIVNLSGGHNAHEPGEVSDTESIYQQLKDFRQERKSDVDQLGTALQSGDLNAAQQAYDALVTLGQNGPFRSSAPFRRTDRAQAFDAIGQALQNGDLAGAQQAFATLAATFGHHGEPAVSGPLPPIIINIGGSSSGTTPPQTDPPTPAPSATLPPTTLPPTSVPPQQDPPTPVDNGSSTGSSPSPTSGPDPNGVPEIIINLGGTATSNGAGQAIIVNVGSGSGSGSGTPEEVKINFGDNGSGGQVTIDVNQNQNGPGEEVSIYLNQVSSYYQLVLNLFDSSSNGQARGNSLSLQA